MPMLVLGIETTCDETAAAVVERQADGSARIFPISCGRRPRNMPPMAAWFRKSRRAPMSNLLDGIVASAMKKSGVDFPRLSRCRGRGRTGPDRRRDRGADHGQGDRTGSRIPLIAVNHLEAHALTPRLTARWHFPIACSSPPAAIPRSSRCSASATTCGSAPRSMMPWAKPSTRWRRCSACPTPAARRSSAPQRAATPNDSISAADARTPRRQFLALRPEDGRA